VHDKADIGAIYPHSERVRRYHNIATALHEFVLRSFPLFVVHPSVVQDARDLCPLESSGDGFHSFSRRAINNASLVSLDQRLQTVVLFRFVCDQRDLEFQVRSCKSRNKFARLA